MSKTPRCRNCCSVFRKTPRPKFLSDRILSRLAAQETVEKIEEPQVALADEAPALNRRSWLRWASAIAAGVGVTGTGLYLFNRSPANITAEGIMDVALHQAFDQVLTAWPSDQTNAKRPFPPQFPLSRVNQRLVESWSTLTFLNRSSAVYRLVHQGHLAALLVSPLAGRPSLPAQLRLDPLRTFAADTNRTCTIWRGGDFLYTLLVLGTHQDLAKFVSWGNPPV